MNEIISSCCQECGVPLGTPHPSVEEDRYNPCPICGATLKDVETRECVYCRTP